MSGPTIHEEFTRLEAKMQDLISLCSTLRLENQSLKNQQSSLEEERARLVKKNELARSKVEQMIVRLKINGSGSMNSNDLPAADAVGSRPARLRILDKEVQIACKPGEEDDLMQAAAYVERSMRDLRSRNTASSIEKLAIVTAINTANALLKARVNAPEEQQVLERVSAINAKLDQLLAESAADNSDAE